MIDEKLITSWSLIETAEQLAQGTVSSVQVTEAYLARIERLNPSLNAFLTVFQETALDQAKESDNRRTNGQVLGQLDGIPLALKDNISTVGQKTTAGSRLLENYEPLYDATVVRKLKAAGAVILGKTNLDEFAMGSSTENSAYGPSKNPWDLSRVPGGSSGGSAVAVAANLCVAALGSDTGGSIRQPASHCGVVGFKPSYGSVSRYGLLAMASSLDQIGPITKTVADATVLWSTIKGDDSFDSTTLPNDQYKSSQISNTPDGPNPVDLKNLKFGVPKEFFGEGINPEVKNLIEQSIEKLKTIGADIVEVSLPLTDSALAVYYVICPVEVASNMARYDGIRFGESLARGDQQAKLLSVYEVTRAKYLGEEVKRRIMLGTYASSAGYYDQYYNQAMKVRTLIKQEYDSVFKQVDFLITPTSPTTAFKLGEKTKDPLTMYLADVNTVPINIAGLPAITIPVALADGLPVGLQLIGQSQTDLNLLSVANKFNLLFDHLDQSQQEMNQLKESA